MNLSTRIRGCYSEEDGRFSLLGTFNLDQTSAVRIAKNRLTTKTALEYPINSCDFLHTCLIHIEDESSRTCDSETKYASFLQFQWYFLLPIQTHGTAIMLFFFRSVKFGCGLNFEVYSARLCNTLCTPHRVRTCAKQLRFAHVVTVQNMNRKKCRIFCLWFTRSRKIVCDVDQVCLGKIIQVFG